MSEIEVPPVMVAVTGLGMEADRKRSAGAGFQYHLVKPVEPRLLRHILESVSASSGAA
jgi:CheY-like chemotaxis protein